MQGCFSILVLMIAPLFVLISLVRWFEQTGEAVDHRQWSRLMLLVAAPFAVWLYPSSVSAGRPGVIPKHEPVRGFGGLPKGGIQDPVAIVDQPPPGTPQEFLGMPKIPPKKAVRAIDPEKIAKLKQKMREQGMIEGEE